MRLSNPHTCLQRHSMKVKRNGMKSIMSFSHQVLWHHMSSSYRDLLHFFISILTGEEDGLISLRNVYTHAFTLLLIPFTSYRLYCSNR